MTSITICSVPRTNESIPNAALGNIETGFTLFKTPKTCITKSCVSSADSKIPKRKTL